MKKSWGGAEYTTRLASDNAQGWVALELHKRVGDSSLVAARVIFWDAQGQSSLAVSVDGLPLAIVEELIAEAKAEIPIQ